jgi:hypothetical protein
MKALRTPFHHAPAADYKAVYKAVYGETIA